MDLKVVEELLDSVEKELKRELKKNIKKEANEMPETSYLKSIVDAVSIKESAKGGYKSFKISPSLKGGESDWYSCFDAKVNDVVQKGNWYNFELTQSGNYWNITKADKAEGLQPEPSREKSQAVESNDKRSRSIVYQAIVKAVLKSQGLMYQGKAGEIDLMEWLSRVKQITEEVIQHHNEIIKDDNVR